MLMPFLITSIFEIFYFVKYCSLWPFTKYNNFVFAKNLSIFFPSWKLDNSYCHKGQHQELDRTEKLARMLVQSLDHDNPKHSYVGVALNRDHSLAWISHMKSLLGMYIILVKVKTL